MADKADKMRKLAAKLCEEIEIRGGSVVLSTHEVIADLLRAELKPLLEIAEEICTNVNPAGTRRVDRTIERLAAELQSWRKEKP